MKFLKNIKKIFLAFIVAFGVFSIAYAEEGGTAESTTTTITAESSTTTTQAISKNQRTIHSANLSFWAGAGLLFPVSNIRNYILQPVPMYEIGMSKSFYNYTPQDFLYVGLIFDYADSRSYYSPTTLANIIKYGCTKTVYTATNLQLVLGIEQTLGTPYLAMYFELGSVFQQRYLIFVNKKYNALPSTSNGYLTTFGGTGNIGLTARLFPKSTITYYLRVGMNLMVNPTKGVENFIGTEKINLNPLSYAPVASLAIRI